jgi:hypothetical protein
MGTVETNSLSIDWSSRSLVVIYENTSSPHYRKGISDVFWKPKSRKLVVRIVSMLSQNDFNGMFLLISIPKSVFNTKEIKIYAEEDWHERLKIDPTAGQLQRATDAYGLLDESIQENIWNWLEASIKSNFKREENMVEFEKLKGEAFKKLKQCDWYACLSDESKRLVKKYLRRWIKVIRSQKEWQSFYTHLRPTREHLENLHLQYAGPELMAFKDAQTSLIWKQMSTTIALASRLPAGGFSGLNNAFSYVFNR